MTPFDQMIFFFYIYHMFTDILFGAALDFVTLLEVTLFLVSILLVGFF